MNKELMNRVLTYRWMIFFTLGIAYIFVFFNQMSVAVVANDIMEDLTCNATVIGIMASIYFYVYAAMQIPAGLLCDSIGSRKTVSFSLGIAALGALVFGFAQTAQVAMIGRGLVGLGVSAVFIALMKIVAEWYAVREFARMQGIITSLGGAGVLLGTFGLGWLAKAYGWRIVFQTIGIASGCLVFLIWFMVRNTPAEKGWPSIAEIENFRTGMVPPERPVPIPLRQGVKLVLKEPRFYPLALWFFCNAGTFFAFGGLWAGPYFMDVYGLSKPETGAILSMIAWTMIAGSPLMAIVSDNLFHSRKKTIIFCTICLAALFIFLRLYPSGLPIPLLYAIIIIFTAFSACTMVVAFTTLKELYPVQIAGTSIAIGNFFPFFGGAVYMAVLGKILDGMGRSTEGGYPVEGYITVLTFLAVSSVLQLICALNLKETFPEKEFKTARHSKKFQQAK
ncbi:MAG: MFS transporter [Deltaproteobacteria bacterium]|nr:MAG: MFS transporter [Deltaproteobacteria bacterium]